MKMLSKRNFLKAKEYIEINGSKLDKAWFDYNFSKMSTNDFLNVLAEYQYPNGGFGGFFHEIKYEGPTLKCTEHAFRYIYYLDNKPNSNHPLIIKMMKYVLDRYQVEKGRWGNFLVPEVNESLHVRWWTYEEDNSVYYSFDERLQNYSPNGQASLAAFVALYEDIVPKDIFEDIIKYPIEKIIGYYDSKSPLFGLHTIDDSTENEIESPYNMKCLQQFCDCLKDKKISSKLQKILCQNPTASMELNQSLWEEGYRETPSDVVTTPNFLYKAIKEEVDVALDALIERQGIDGAWHLSWKFGDEDEFRQMERNYETYMTTLYLAELKRFKRIL